MPTEDTVCKQTVVRLWWRGQGDADEGRRCSEVKENVRMIEKYEDEVLTTSAMHATMCQALAGCHAFPDFRRGENGVGVDESGSKCEWASGAGHLDVVSNSFHHPSMARTALSLLLHYTLLIERRYSIGCRIECASELV